ncbi:MAG: cysteine rich repeat-containing protein [Bauldia sp.]
MSKAALLMLVLTMLAPGLASAEGEPGTPQERAACRADVRKFCQAVKPGSGNAAFLTCLVERRNDISPACLTVLQNHNIL